MERLEELIAQRRAEPTDDLLSELVHVEEQGDQLSREELISTVMLLFGAGFEDPTSLLPQLVSSGLLVVAVGADEVVNVFDSVCPAGEEVIAPFLNDRKEFLKDVLKPLQDKVETVYVVPGSDAEDYVRRRFPHKTTKRVRNGLAGQGTIRAFLRGLNFVFQRGNSEGLDATYHFTFTGHDEVKATVTIRDEKLQVSEGHNGQPDLRLTADSQTWLRFLRKEANLVWALLRRKIRIQGSPKLLLAFGRCFPS